ncbi:NACHT domain-containing protein [Klebsiella aerogenes]|uniref:NACHT domain-containing protein n=1 Tax=Klebsiella aerogenes TaxID=548 RepID=UPI0021D16253|nr:hypothetical protein [Klebsiella aerogenes]MCU6421259.1 hypothetical protein [Klebsiella aerogenes]
MVPYIDVNRRFYKSSHAQEEIPEHLYGEWFEDHNTIDWNELLKYSRAVILADAGAGKTREMQEQVKRLKQDGHFAFFIPLEALTDESITELLIPADLTQFEQWQNGSDNAYFFLDAVDELKLKGDKFEKALRKIQQQLKDNASRCKLFISCRPKDWSNFDLSAIEQWFPACVQESIPASIYEKKNGQELLIDIVSEWDKQPQESFDLIKGNEQQTNYNQVNCFYMRHLSNKQIRNFVEKYQTEKIDNFLQRIHELNAEIFAGRPQDLIYLIEYWNTHQQFDSMLLLYEADIRNKISETANRSELVLKSSSEIRTAVEKLALAISMTRKRTISIAERPSSTPDSLDPARVLPDWSSKEINSLLRLAIFDPATYERVRFHHRSVQEYLAACRLQFLTSKGMSINERFNLLFSDRYDLSVVIPSMRPVAAWMALHDGDVRKELMRREPETLLSYGDPSSLPVETRAVLLRQFVELYSKGTSRGINIPLSSVAKLSHPELKSTIELLWVEGYMNDDVRELLLEIIWTGKIKGCSSLLKTAIYDPYIPIEDRLIAIQAIDSTMDTVSLNKIVTDIIQTPSLWPDKFIFYFVEEFFPRTLSVDELAILIKRTTEPRSTTNGFKWVLQSVAEKLAPLSSAATAFRDMLTEIILGNIILETQSYQPESKFGYLSRALIKICERQISNQLQQDDKKIILPCLVGCLFINKEHYHCQDEINYICSMLNSLTTIREQIFKTEWTLLKQVSKSSLIAPRISAFTVLSPFKEDDMKWLISLLHDENDVEHKAALLNFILRFVLPADVIVKYKKELIQAIKKDKNLLATLTQWFTPTPRPVNQEFLKQEQEWKIIDKKRQEENERHKKECIQGWVKWHNEIMIHDAAFTSKNCQQLNLHRCITLLINTIRSFEPKKVWNRELLQGLFGKDKTEQIEKIIQQQWRNTPTLLWSKRAPENKNSLSIDEKIARVGLHAESMNPGWYKNITNDETSQAVLYSVLGSDTFLPSLNQLAINFPVQVTSILSDELRNSSHYIDNTNYIPIIHCIKNATLDVRNLLADVISEITIDSIRKVNKKTQNNTLRTVGDLLVSIIDIIPDDRKQHISKLLAQAYLKSPYEARFYCLLKYAFNLSSQTGLKTLKKSLSRSKNKEQYIINIYASIFSSRSHGMRWRGRICSHQTPEVLGELLSIAYSYIKREDDREHDGLFTPNVRDNAEEARNNILSALLNIDNKNTVSELLQLSQQKQFNFSKDRIEFLARERAAASSELIHLTEDGFINLENQLEQIPNDQHSLFTVMINRLNDLQYALSHSDFTDRDILSDVKRESQMQATLAWRLEAMAKSAYSVVRESEVADGKKTDIRLLSSCGRHKAVIELKIAENGWRIADFERALEHQLVGQYLRYDGCKSGCLLITYNGQKKRWRDPLTKKHLNFNKLVDLLNAKAEHLMAKDSSLRLKVIGLDLTAPYLSPAH